MRVLKENTKNCDLVFKLGQDYNQGHDQEKDDRKRTGVVDSSCKTAWYKTKDMPLKLILLRNTTAQFFSEV